MLSEKLPKVKIFSEEPSDNDNDARKINITIILDVKICSLAFIFGKKYFFMMSLVTMALELK